ncbi:hypothetical protein TRVA0_073S00210 [Trichomonascus vanleenenianus]|uniref:uncharacterized protein n=1 Tax=Trichomonascus vanleenenianus TaxID=2268995 RepID=UPI003ECABA2D
MEISDLNLSDAELRVPPRPNLRSTARNNASRFEDLEFTELSDIDLFPKAPKFSTPYYRQPSRNNNILSPRLGTEDVNRHFTDFSFANSKQLPDDSIDHSIEIGRGLARNASARYNNRQTSMSSNGSPKPTKVTDKRASPKKVYISEIEEKAKKNGIVIPTEYRDDDSFFKSLNIPTRNPDRKPKSAQETHKGNAKPKPKPSHPSDTENAAILPDVTGLSSIFSSDTGSTRRRNRDTGHKTIVSVPMDPDDQALFTAFNSFEQKIDRLEKEKKELNERLEALSRGGGAAAHLKKMDDELRELKERYHEEGERYAQMEAKARKYKSAIVTLRDRYLAQKQSLSDDEIDVHQWKAQYDKLKLRAQELAFEKEEALEQIRAKEHRISELEGDTELLKGSTIKPQQPQRQQQSRVSFDGSTAPQSTSREMSIETNDQPQPQSQPQTPQPQKTVNGEIISLLLRTLDQQTLDDKESKRKTMTLLQQFVDLEEKEREEQLEAEAAAAESEKHQVIEALQDALEKLQSAKPAPASAFKAKTNFKPFKPTLNDKTKKPKMTKAKSPKRRVEIENEEDVDADESESVDSDVAEATDEANTESEEESEVEVKPRRKKKAPAKRQGSTAADHGLSMPTLMNRVFGFVPRECEICLRNGISLPSAGVWGKKPTCPHGKTYPASGFSRRYSSDHHNEDDTVRPSMSPEESAKIVLDKMTEEWRELQDEYLALTEDYNSKDPAKQRRKRSELADRIKIIINEMESKADQIYAMHDVMTAANIPTTVNLPQPPNLFFDDQSMGDNDNDDAESQLDREQYLGKTEWLNT